MPSCSNEPPVMFTSRRYFSPYLIMIFTAHKRSLGQGNVFTPVSHSVHGGRGVHPQADTPRQTNPLGRHPPGQTRPPPQDSN